jgi:hypothetical protein
LKYFISAIGKPWQVHKQNAVFEFRPGIVDAYRPLQIDRSAEMSVSAF